MSLDHDETSTVNLEERPPEGLRRTLYIIIFEADTKLGKLFDVVLLWAILISVTAVILESDKYILKNTGSFLIYLEWVLTGFFTTEYLLRLYVSKSAKKYAFSFFGVIDLLAIIPTYISLLLPGTHYFMVVRVLRLLRVFRILKLVRFVRAASILGEAVKASRYKIFVFMGVIISMVLVFGTCMYIVEGEESGFVSIPQSMYWTIVTMTTVGYGDIVPMTVLGKFVASAMMLVGYAIIAVPTGIVTSELAEATRHANMKRCSRCKEPLVDQANYCHKCGEGQ
jgi:voltage-gated potassium channel